jgi:hypothetical protein
MRKTPTVGSLGITELSFEDKTRIVENSPRLLNVTIWYPTSQSERSQKLEFGIWKIKDAARNAPILSHEKKRPLILFSHGYIPITLQDANTGECKI